MTIQNQPSCFEADRFILRRFVSADANDIVNALNDAEMCRGLSVVPFPYTLDDAHAFIELGDALAAFAIVRKDGALIGSVGLGKQLGYWVAKPFWRQGYAFAASSILVSEHFERCSDPIASGYVDDNHASAAVLAKLGFEVISDQMLHIKSRGREVPAKSVQLTKARWETRQ